MSDRFIVVLWVWWKETNELCCWNLRCDEDGADWSQVFLLIMMIRNAVWCQLPEAQRSEWCYWLWSGTSEEEVLNCSVNEQLMYRGANMTQLFLSTLHSFISLWDSSVIDGTIECCLGASRHLVSLLCAQAASAITALVQSRVYRDVLQVALREWSFKAGKS